MFQLDYKYRTTFLKRIIEDFLLSVIYPFCRILYTFSATVSIWKGILNQVHVLGGG